MVHFPCPSDLIQLVLGELLCGSFWKKRSVRAVYFGISFFSDLTIRSSSFCCSLLQQQLKSVASSSVGSFSLFSPAIAAAAAAVQLRQSSDRTKQQSSSLFGSDVGAAS